MEGIDTGTGFNWHDASHNWTASPRALNPARPPSAPADGVPGFAVREQSPDSRPGPFALKSVHHAAGVLRLHVAIDSWSGTRIGFRPPQAEASEPGRSRPALDDLKNLQRAASLAARKSLDFITENRIGLRERRGDRLVRVFPDGRVEDEGPASNWWEGLHPEETDVG